MTLEELYGQACNCHKCALGETRTTLVFGAGNPNADIMLIGEAPGRNEDLQGVPFVGRAGQLLDQMLQSVGLVREDIYIANILKCRPPLNRDPRPDEIELCTPWLREQIKAVHPTVLVTMGNFATKFVLQTNTGITRLHGTIQTTGPFRVIPIYHPAAAIYDSTKLAALEEDFGLVKRLVEADEQRAARAQLEADGNRETR